VAATGSGLTNGVMTNADLLWSKIYRDLFFKQIQFHGGNKVDRDTNFAGSSFLIVGPHFGVLIPALCFGEYTNFVLILTDNAVSSP